MSEAWSYSLKPSEKNKKPRITKHDYEMYLNELGVPEEYKYRNGGRVKSRKWGEWMRLNDPIAFQVGYNEYCLQ